MKTRKKGIPHCVIVFCLLLFGMAVAANTQDDEIRLIVRGDDMGMTQGSLVAFERAFSNGILTCGGVQVVGPWFEGAAELCKRNPGWCVGVHLALVGEWRGYRWRPVLPWSQVSSLVDEDGFLFRYPDELLANNPDPDEMEAELRAQIELALKKGINVQYIDIHYGGMDTKIVEKLGREYSVPVSSRMGEKRCGSIFSTPVEEKTETAVKILQELAPGLWLMVCHPGIDSPEQNALIHMKPGRLWTGGGIGRHRAAETDALTHIDVKSAILFRGIKLTNYRELWEEQEK